MAKKKTWFSLIKRLFISEPQSRLEKDKRRRWVFRLVKMKEVPWQSAADEEKESQESTKNNVQMASQDFAATKIQSAYRGHLARKALRALKGVVKLQALIRGWAVRQQAINTLKCLQSLVNIQSQVFSKRCEGIKDSLQLHREDYKPQDFSEKDIKVDLNSEKRWDESTLTKEELTKREARERAKEYYLNHRRSAETERDKVYGRRRYWLEQWVDAQLAKGDSPRNLDRTLSDNGGTRNLQNQMSESPTYIPKRPSHHRKQRSIGDPAYMASTESAKAKARSISSPRLRPLSFDVSSEITSPYKHKFSPISSINSEPTGSSLVAVTNHISSSQRSPRLKGMAGPVKSTMSTKDIRLRGIQHQNGVGVEFTGGANPMGK